MEAVMLRVYVAEGARREGVLLWEWLLQAARRQGVPGGTALRAVGGFGRHHVVHESRFVELAGKETVVVEFVLPAADVDALLSALTVSGEPLLYAQWPLQFGLLGAGCAGAGDG